VDVTSADEAFAPRASTFTSGDRASAPTATDVTSGDGAHAPMVTEVTSGVEAGTPTTDVAGRPTRRSWNRSRRLHRTRLSQWRHRTGRRHLRRRLQLGHCRYFRSVSVFGIFSVFFKVGIGVGILKYRAVDIGIFPRPLTL